MPVIKDPADEKRSPGRPRTNDVTKARWWRLVTLVNGEAPEVYEDRTSPNDGDDDHWLWDIEKSDGRKPGQVLVSWQARTVKLRTALLTYFSGEPAEGYHVVTTCDRWDDCVSPFHTEELPAADGFRINGERNAEKARQLREAQSNPGAAMCENVSPYFALLVDPEYADAFVNPGERRPVWFWAIDTAMLMLERWYMTGAVDYLDGSWNAAKVITEFRGTWILNPNYSRFAMIVAVESLKVAKRIVASVEDWESPDPIWVWWRYHFESYTSPLPVPCRVSIHDVFTPPNA